MPPDIAAKLDQAKAYLARGQISEAKDLARSLLAARPRLGGALLLLGLCHQQAGESEAAQAAFEAGLKTERGDAELASALADLHLAASRPAEAERVLRRALEANRRAAPLAARLARLLTASGRAAEALAVTGRLAASPAPDHTLLAEHAAALKGLGRVRDAAATYARAATLFPEDPIALHNLAASQGDAGEFAAAAQNAARALRHGPKPAPTWLVYARALLGQGKLDEAERAFREAIARAPAYLDPHRELAQLIWMRTEDAGVAVSLLDGAIAAHPHLPELAGLRATVLDHAGDTAGAYETLAGVLRRHPGEARLHMAAATLAARLDGGAAQGVAHAERAAALSPGDDGAVSVLCAAYLAAGEVARASALAGALLARHPFDQRALAYQATAWRLAGDARAASLYDYAGLVRPWRMDVPDGWPTLEAYLAELTAALGGVHPYRTHPLDQSVRHGSQAMGLLTAEHPAIKAFFRAVDGPIRRHLAALGGGTDPVRVRNIGGYRFAGAWSVKLRPGGYHTDHIHPEGWLSSACYIALPPSTEADRAARAAWIKFGQPGTPTAPALEAEHFVEPEPGMVVLFPSYTWHGTVPFRDANRLSIAFDLVPGSVPAEGR